MPAQVKKDPRRDFVRLALPCILMAVMLLVYLLTLNSWIGYYNVAEVAKISGWLWGPDLNTPLFHLATLPLRMLPATAIPPVLNLFSVLCATLTLGMLARSVALLPHDRTEAQLARERNDFALLTLPSAWLPSVLAVLLCGMQLSFWESATNGGSQMFDVLLFAFVIWSLLEYRLDERESRLFWSAGVVGAAMAEGPAMTGFFPVFFASIIWVRGLNFFNVQFLTRMLLCGLAGFSLFLLFPVLAAISGQAPLLLAFKLSLAQQIQVAKLYFYCVANLQQYFDNLIVPLCITLMPLLMLSIRWKIGDSSRLGSFLANSAFHSIHAIFLFVCVWLMFDPPFSPREKGLGLTLYYINALSIGYYLGYFLLIFGKKHPRAEEFPPIMARLFNLAVVGATWLLAILAIAGLFYKNTPLIRMVNDNVLHKYISLAAENLPRPGAIVLSDDPTRLYLTQAEMAREGRAKDYLWVDTRMLPYPQYHAFLHKEMPQKWPLLVSPTQTNTLNRIGLISMLAMLCQSNQLYYLHPSFGYYFEEFYLEPHGMIYKLKILPNDTLLPPTPDKNLVAENEAFWAEAQTQVLATVENILAPPVANAPETFAQKQFARLRVPQEQNINAAAVGMYGSRSLNLWGVELQRAGYLTNATQCFQAALKLNTNNIIAQINLDFNQDLRAGHRPAVDFARADSYNLDQFASLPAIINEDGPFDEPAFCFEYGFALAQDNQFFRQAAEPFERVRQLVPGFLPARLWLAQIYALNRLPDRVLEVLRGPLDHPADFSVSGANSTQINVLTAAAYFQKNDEANGSRILEMAMSRDPSNDVLAATAARVYLNRSMYSDALNLVNRKLEVSPDNPYWLYTKGYIYNQQKKYREAAGIMTRVLAIQKDNNDALYQRGNAYLGSGDLAAARADYQKLQEIDTNSYQIAYRLGDIAWQQHDTNEAIRNFKIYLPNAPTNSAEDQTVRERLRELE